MLYRHEPDLVTPCDALPLICRPEEWDRYRALMRAYIQRMIATRNLKALGTWPVFGKSFDRPGGRLVRTALIVSMRALQTIRAGDVHDHTLPTEWISLPTGARPHIVVKSISALGRAGLLAEAAPEARIVLIIRNPLAQIASRSVGLAQGKLEAYRFRDAILATSQARNLGVTSRTIAASTIIEQMAWEWAILNQKALDDLAGRANAIVTEYSDIVMNPEARMRSLLGFAGLDWHKVTEAFVHRSVNYRGPDMYFQVLKNSIRSLDKWRTVLSCGDQARIRAVVERTRLASYWPDCFNTRTCPAPPFRFAGMVG